MPGRAQAWVRRWLPRLLLLSLSLGGTLLGLEVALAQLGVAERPPDWRARGLFQPDAELIFSLVPDAEAVWTTAEFVERVHINSAGLRDREIAAIRPGERRLIVLGDSMVFGHGVDDDESFPNQLERVLAERGHRIDVVNGAVKGYGSDHAFKLFATRLRALEPDLLVFCVYRNDLLDNIHRPLYTIEDGDLVELDPRRDYLYRLGSVLQKVPSRLHELRLVRFVAERLAGYGARRPKRELPVEDWYRWSREKFAIEVRRLKQMGDADGFAVLVVGIPSRDQEAPYGWIGEMDLGGVPFFDAPALPGWRAGTEDLFFETDHHMTVAGNGRLARDLAAYLETSAPALLAAGRAPAP